MGTGAALRQFVYVEDLAALVAHLVHDGPRNETLNVAPDGHRSIRELAGLVAAAAGYGGEVVFTGEGPDGQLRKDVTSARLCALVPEWPGMVTPLEEGLRRTIAWYREHVSTRA
jgi:GDP-L-fucose synthase